MSNQRQKAEPIGPLTGQELLGAIVLATDYLSASAGALNKINVYPVQDGDTGSNMASTLRGACNQAKSLPTTAKTGQVLTALAEGALYASRGSSGVILSQALLELAKSLAQTSRLRGPEIARGLRAAADGARAAVANPVEGTMLTVLQAAADGAKQAKAQNPALVLENALSQAEAATAKTTSQLPALGRAGVTDAGGEGVCAILRGIVAALRNKTPPPIIFTGQPKTEPVRALGGPSYCLVFLLAPKDETDDKSLRQYLAGRGCQSIAIATGQKVWRIHAHTNQPEALLEESKQLGRVSDAKYESLN